MNYNIHIHIYIYIYTITLNNGREQQIKMINEENILKEN